MSDIKYMREGRGVCKSCTRELDVVVEYSMGKQSSGIVISRHLNRIEEYTSKGARPEGFCPGSFGEADPIKTPDVGRGKRRE